MPSYKPSSRKSHHSDRRRRSRTSTRKPSRAPLQRVKSNPLSSELKSTTFQHLERPLRYKCAIPRPRVDTLSYIPRLEFQQEASQYRTTQLENTFRHDILTEFLMGIHVDLINPYETYDTSNESKEIDPADVPLLEGYSRLNSMTSSTSSRKSLAPQRHETWLRKPQYLSNSVGVATGRPGLTVAPVTASPQPSLTTNNTSTTIITPTSHTPEKIYKTQSEIHEEIEKSFQRAQSQIPTTHPTRQGVKCQQVFDFVPNMNLWPYEYFIAQFDSDTLPTERFANLTHDQKSQKRRALGNRLYRGGLLEQSGPFTNDRPLDYSLPPETTMGQTNPYSKEDYTEYQHVRKYITRPGTNIQDSSDAGHFMVLDENVALYCPLQRVLPLTKAAAVGQGTTMNDIKPDVYVIERELLEGEIQKHEEKKKELVAE